MRDKPEFGGAIPWIRIEDLDGKYVSDSKSGQYVSEQTVHDMSLKVLPIGTVLCSCSCRMGTTAIVAKPLATNQTFAGIVCGNELAPEFAYYALQAISEQLQATATGAIQQYLSREDLQRLRILAPPRERQLRISAYLDNELAAIDCLIAKKQRLIELLEEKRAALISRAVTQGLDPGVPMKDSGVEWLGRVPAHWHVCRVKYAIRSMEQGWSPQCDNAPAAEDSGVY